MTLRIIDARSGELIITMTERRLLKFIGWCEAHRQTGEYEPGFLTQCMTDLECASGGYALDATAECAACGEEYPLQSAGAHLYQDGEWYCKNHDECKQRQDKTEAERQATEEEAAAEAQVTA